VRAEIDARLMELADLIPGEAIAAQETARAIANVSCGQKHRGRKAVTRQHRVSLGVKVLEAVIKSDAHGTGQ